jgi:ArsR family transcriptional regulator
LSDREAAQLERLFKALGDRHRVKIVNLLAGSQDAICVCKLIPALGLAQATVSYHLKLLVDAGVVEREQRGRFGFYRIAPEAFDRLGEVVRQPTRDFASAL